MSLIVSKSIWYLTSVNTLNTCININSVGIVAKYKSRLRFNFVLYPRLHVVFKKYPWALSIVKAFQGFLYMGVGVLSTEGGP